MILKSGHRRLGRLRPGRSVLVTALLRAIPAPARLTGRRWWIRMFRDTGLVYCAPIVVCRVLRSRKAMKNRRNILAGQSLPLGGFDFVGGPPWGKQHFVGSW